MFLAFGITISLGMLLLGAWIASEWTYICRLRHFAKDLPRPPEWHRPQELVRGVAAPALIPKADENSLDTNLVAKALATATKGNAGGFLILHRGKIVTEYYSQAMPPNRWTDSASMMKTVTSLLVGKAIAEGKIKSVDQPAADYIAQWKKDGRRAITIRNLLQMHSGLRPDGEYEDPFSDACYLALGTDLAGVVNGVPLVVAPGTQYDYSNINYQALGMILENATGRRYAELLSEKLWIPLGNGDAAVWLDQAKGTARTFGFMFAAPEDWARVGQLIMDRGRAGGRQLISEQWIDFICTPSPHEPTYGAGLYTGVDDSESAPFADRDTVALNGRGKQRVYVLRSRAIVIVRVGPRPEKWDDSFFPNLFSAAAK